jgi:CheY-like chemotaxis protein
MVNMAVRGTKILVAEDNPVNRELIRELLEFRGYEVIEAADGKQAWDLIVREAPALVLADIQMPNMSGFDLVDEIRHNATLSNLPVIALTAYAMGGDRDRAIQNGFNGYITKPIDSAVFFAEIQRCIGMNGQIQ